MVGAWETGEGERVPPPRRPHPPWRYPPGPVHGGRPAKNRARLSTGSTPDTAAHQVSPRTDPAPRWGRGRSAAGAGGVGLPAEGYGYPPAKARVGRGCRQKGMGILCRRHGWGGDAGRSARVSPAEGTGGVGAAGRKERRPPATLRPGVDHDRGESDEGDRTDEEGDVSCTEGFTPDVQGGVCPVAPAEHARVGALALLV